MRAARDLRDFDEIFTGPLHGFAGADDYYARSSAKAQLNRIRIPALVLNARNDPFLPASALPRPGEVGPCVTLWQPAHGGHVRAILLSRVQGFMGWPAPPPRQHRLSEQPEGRSLTDADRGSRD